MVFGEARWVLWQVEILGFEIAPVILNRSFCPNNVVIKQSKRTMVRSAALSSIFVTCSTILSITISESQYLFFTSSKSA